MSVSDTKVDHIMEIDCGIASWHSPAIVGSEIEMKKKCDRLETIVVSIPPKKALQ